MARRILVVRTASAPQADVERIVRAHAGADAEVQVVAPASKISGLDRLTNAEDDVRADAADWAEVASEAATGDQADGHIVHRSYGPFMLGVVAVGLVAFALYSLSDARYRKI